MSKSTAAFAAGEQSKQVVSHTPTPWAPGTATFDEGWKLLGPEGSSESPEHPTERAWVATVYDAADRDFIVRAVNSHEELLSALEWAMCHIREPRRIKGQNDSHCDAYDRARSAISKAKAHE
jgi:hypothetical protein